MEELSKVKAILPSKQLLRSPKYLLNTDMSNQIFEEIEEENTIYTEEYREALIDEIKNFDEDLITDYKTSLQEEMQTDRRGTVHYRVVESYGPAHAPTFVVEVYFNDICLGRGVGSSKKEAEQKAAKDALTKKAV